MTRPGSIKRWLSGLGCTLGLVVMLAHPGHADEAVRIRNVDTSAFPTVAVTVSVPAGVLAEDIEVEENGGPVSILTVRPLIASGQEVDVVLAIDTSDSVRGAPLAAAVSAAKTFVDQLPEAVGVGVVTFSKRPSTIVGITRDRSAVLSALDSLGATQRGTAVYDAIGTAARLFSGPGQHNIVLLTDGSDVSSSLDLAGAVEAARNARASVFTVGLEARRTDFAGLQQLADETGGRFAPATSDRLEELYTSLAGSLSEQHLVIYRSEAVGGTQVTVTVLAGESTDLAIVLMPRIRPPAEGSGPGWLPALQGPWGLAIVLSVSFASVFLLILLVVGWITRVRWERDLARRVATPHLRDHGAPERPDRGPTAWIPRPVVEAAEHMAAAAGFKASLDRRLERAGLPLRAGELLAGSAVAAMLAGLVTMILFRNIVLALAVAMVAGIVPHVLVSVAIDRRLQALNDQLPDVLMILASSMRAGHSFLQALDTVSKEIGQPAGPEFARVVAEIRLGRPFEEAMNAMAERVESEEFTWALLAVNIQREVGGNLAEILDTLSETVREREAVRRQVKVLSSEGRLSVRILVALPFLITIYVIKVNPDYMRLLWTTWIGGVLIGVGSFLMLLGVIWARKTVKISV
jgi:tight adherence protein B